MLKENIAFGSFSVSNYEEAKKFYVDLLGLEFTRHEIGFMELHTHGNHPMMVYEKENHTPASYTVLNFLVDNLEDFLKTLSSNGATAEQYDEPMKTNNLGVHTSEGGAKIAWVKDPAQNVIAFIQM